MTLIAPGHPPASDAPHPLFVRAFEYPLGYTGFSHRHRLAQLVYAIRGVVSVDTEAGTWVVTARSAVAIPPWRMHRVAAHGNASLRSLFIDPDVYPDLVPALATVQVSDLLHELIREAGSHYTDFDPYGDVAGDVVALIARLVPSMPSSQAASVWLPSVELSLLRPVADALFADPSDATTAEEWAHRLALSPRHFSRCFKQETGVTFSTWRALMQVRQALVRLAQGESVTRVAMDLGYSSTSAFIEMFKRHAGSTPGTSVAARAST